MGTNRSNNRVATRPEFHDGQHVENGALRARSGGGSRTGKRTPFSLPRVESVQGLLLLLLLLLNNTLQPTRLGMQSNLDKEFVRMYTVA
jgi:hypothetical protein